MIDYISEIDSDNFPFKDLDKEPFEGSNGSPMVLSPIQQLQLAKLAEIGCTTNEMLIILGLAIHPNTLISRYGDIIEYGRSQGNKSLRVVQFKKALEGNVDMLKWLGKQRLGQYDDKVSGHNEPLPWSDDD